MLPLSIFIIYGSLITYFAISTNGFDYQPTAEYCIKKCLPIIALAGMVFSGMTKVGKKYKTIHIWGILFGGIGDFLIAFLHNNLNALVYGAIAFAVGHLLYMMTFFPKIKHLNKSLSFGVFFAIFSINYFILFPNFDNEPLPTIIMSIYSIILGLCFLGSGSQYMEGSTQYMGGQKFQLFRFIGFSLFLASDFCLLLANKGHRHSFSESFIMLTYYGAQLFITSAMHHEEILKTR
uniref:lysoplasmalogenase n=1 Tax=Parastrongyloides trichosuri TaxID=131310 RepID=A0A0N4Z535_PARTI